MPLRRSGRTALFPSSTPGAFIAQLKPSTNDVTLGLMRAAESIGVAVQRFQPDGTKQFCIVRSQSAYLKIRSVHLLAILGHATLR
jgi:hypothetical protein